MNEITNVKFYKNNDEVFAIFLDEITFEENMFSGYAHIGQHSLIHFQYIKESEVAKKDEYIELYNELTNLIGYKLNVINKN